MEYMSCPQAAKKWSISERRVQKLCEENRIPGVSKIGYMWLIPKDAEKPTDKRRKNEFSISYYSNIRGVHCKQEVFFMATILIIEDDRETNEAICEYLKSAGHITFSVYDGADALTVFAQRNIDLVVLDIMLPTITGLGVLHEIRKKSSVPVLMLTAIKDEYTQVTSFDEQADDYVTKPFSMVLLGKRITALLRRMVKQIYLIQLTLVM